MKENASFQVDAADFYMRTIMWSNRELGKYVRSLFKLLEDEKYDELQECPLVIGIHEGFIYRRNLPSSTKREILAAGECLFCGTTDNLTVDHIKPWSKGGTHDSFNLQCLCFKCNILKSDKYKEPK